jgi:hypothetical protein
LPPSRKWSSLTRSTTTLDQELSTGSASKEVIRFDFCCVFIGIDELMEHFQPDGAFSWFFSTLPKPLKIESGWSDQTSGSKMDRVMSTLSDLSRGTLFKEGNPPIKTLRFLGTLLSNISSLCRRIAVNQEPIAWKVCAKAFWSHLVGIWTGQTRD